MGALLRRTTPLQGSARGRQVWIEFLRPAEIGNRARLVAGLHPAQAAVIPGIGIGRIVLQRLVVIGEAALDVILIEPDEGAVAIAPCI